MSLAHDALVDAGMAWYRWRYWRPLDRAATRPRAAQAALLRRLLTANAGTEFGAAHRFEAIATPADYDAAVPIQEYEDLRPYVERQRTTGAAALTAEAPVLYARTSGSTGAPKYVPITASVLAVHRAEQKIFSYLQHRACPAAFRGRTLGIMGAAVEGTLDSGHTVGSVSGHLYRSMPRLVRARFVVPPDVSAVPDYDLKYRLILRLALEAPDITYLGAPNPSSFLRLATLLELHRDELTDSLATGRFDGDADLPASTRAAIEGRITPQPARAAAIARLPALTFRAVWPRIALVTTWTGGSCGIALGALRPMLPPTARVMELGYQSTEFRGTLALAPDVAGGLAPLHHTYVEFVEETAWNEGRRNTCLIDELEPGRRYQVVVTTAGGLYRYAMNDLVEVAGVHRATPLLRFVQKGRGVTNLTGEKLYESQVIDAVQQAAAAHGLHPSFFLMVADEMAQQYRLFVETRTAVTPAVASAIIAAVDAGLAARNLEYHAKRDSGRLARPALVWVGPEAGDAYKAACVRSGQREGQYKPAVLVYAREMKLAPEALVTAAVS
jgi:hypothetical protein